ncbi:hypothetical protein [Streptomyces sp. NPDC005898]
MTAAGPGGDALGVDGFLWGVLRFVGAVAAVRALVASLASLLSLPRVW